MPRGRPKKVKEEGSQVDQTWKEDMKPKFDENVDVTHEKATEDDFYARMQKENMELKKRLAELEKKTEAPFETNHAETPIEELPLETYRDYVRYNERARAANKKAKKLLYPMKQCPIELHPKQRIRFQRNDQPTNPLHVKKSNDIIDYEETLIPGRVYELPNVICDFLNKRGTPIWERKEKPKKPGQHEAEWETVLSGFKNRFALQAVFEGEE